MGLKQAFLLSLTFVSCEQATKNKNNEDANSNWEDNCEFGIVSLGVEYDYNPMHWLISVQEFVDQLNERETCLWHDPFGGETNISFSVFFERTGDTIIDRDTRTVDDPNSSNLSDTIDICMEDITIPTMFYFSEGDESISIPVDIMVIRGGNRYEIRTDFFDFGDIAIPTNLDESSDFFGKLVVQGDPADRNGEIFGVAFEGYNGENTYVAICE